MLENRLRQQIEQAGQGHLLQFWNELTSDEQETFAAQLSNLNWDLVNSYRPDSFGSPDFRRDDIRRATPPAHVVRIPKTEEERRQRKQARSIGEAAIRDGKVGAVLLAGGQGTRLGFKHSKGLFPIAPITGKTLLEIFATQLVAISEKYGRAVPYFIMTSQGTHHEIEEFLKSHSYFGLNPADVFLFHQGFAPSIDLETGKVFLSGKGALSLNPDGHGGIFAALWKAGLFDTMKDRGIEYLFSHQVDNPLAKICDPEFVGLHILHESEASTKVVAKTSPQEKVGVAVDLDGQTHIIEYIDLPDDLANSRDADGDLRFWAGNTAIHLFSRIFLERVATSNSALPWHRAIKKISHVDSTGHSVVPEKENGVKFEQFIFDTLPLAKVALVVETLRDEEFAPLKNKEGEFSAEYVRDRMSQLCVNWLKAAGAQVRDGVTIEISPRFALTVEDVASRFSRLKEIIFDRSQYLSHDREHSPTHEKSPHTGSGGTALPPLDQPLVFDTFFRPQVWGGRGLEGILGRTLPQSGPYGEAWDLSAQKLHNSRVTEGPHAGKELSELWADSRRELTGQEGSGPFPLLLKWLECHEQLSLQVHPSDDMARRVLGEPYGKSEAWVVIHAEPTARIYAGLKPGVTRQEFLASLEAGTLQESLHSFVPNPGDCISIPAGTVHAAGGGLIIAEVQQSSDATFRLFDWNRLGLDGKPRPLQIEHGLDAIDWNQGPVSPVNPWEIPVHSTDVQAEKLVEGHGFRMERFRLQSESPVPYRGEFTIWMVLEGTAELLQPTRGYQRRFSRGTTVVIPAAANELVWKPQANGRLLNLLCIRLQ